MSNQNRSGDGNHPRMRREMEGGSFDAASVLPSASSPAPELTSDRSGLFGIVFEPDWLFEEVGMLFEELGITVSRCGAQADRGSDGGSNINRPSLLALDTSEGLSGTSAILEPELARNEPRD